MCLHGPPAPAVAGCHLTGAVTQLQGAVGREDHDAVSLRPTGLAVAGQLGDGSPAGLALGVGCQAPRTSYWWDRAAVHQ